MTAKEIVERDILGKVSDIVADLNDTDFLVEDVMEWWAVSEGATVIEKYRMPIWCRKTTGAAIAGDWVIEKISKQDTKRIVTHQGGIERSRPVATSDLLFV